MSKAKLWEIRWTYTTTSNGESLINKGKAIAMDDDGLQALKMLSNNHHCSYDMDDERCELTYLAASDSNHIIVEDPEYIPF